MKNYQIIIEAIEAVNEGREIPKKVGDFRIKWHATDGWRGYYESEPTKKSRWAREDSDWITGNWPDAGDNASSSQEEKLDQLAEKLAGENKDMAVIFMPTSNVFSTVFDVYSRTKL